MSYEAIPFPTGSSNAQLYAYAANLTQNLRRILQELTDGSDVDLEDLATDIATIQGDVGTLQGNVTVLQGDVATAQGDITTLSGHLSDVSNAIMEDVGRMRDRVRTQLQINADAAIAAAIEENRKLTAIKTAIQVRIDETLALSERIDSVNASLGVTGASVTTLERAVVDGTNALATQITNVATQVAGNTASVEQIIESVDGIRATYSVQLQSGGRFGFFKMDGTPGEVTAIFGVDKFALTGTDVENPVVPFYVDNTGPTPLIYMGGEVIAPLSITTGHLVAGSVSTEKLAALAVSAEKIAAEAVVADKIAANAVTADKIAANAITADKINANEITADKIAINGLTGSVVESSIENSSTTKSGDTFSTVPGMSLDVTVGANEKVLLTAYVGWLGTSTDGYPATFELWMDGSKLTGAPPLKYGVGGGTLGPDIASQLTFIASPSAGAHTFTIVWKTGLGLYTKNNYRYFAAMRFLR